MLDRLILNLTEAAECSEARIDALSREAVALQRDLDRMQAFFDIQGHGRTMQEVATASRELNAEFGREFTVSEVPDPVIALAVLRFVRDFAKTQVFHEFVGDLRSEILPELVRNSAASIADTTEETVKAHVDAKLKLLSAALGDEIPNMIGEAAEKRIAQMQKGVGEKFDALKSELRAFAATIPAGKDGKDGEDGEVVVQGVGLRLAGPWRKGTRYSTGDIVELEGSSWVARKDKVRTKPRNGDQWQLMAAAGSITMEYAHGGGGAGSEAQMSVSGRPVLTAFPSDAELLAVDGNGQPTLLVFEYRFGPEDQHLWGFYTNTSNGGIAQATRTG